MSLRIFTTLVAATVLLGVAAAAQASSASTFEIIEVTPANMNGWSLDGYQNWAPGDPAAGGGATALVDPAAAPAATANGAWYHKSVYPNAPASYTTNAYSELAFGGFAGRKVSDWRGFEYRNYQLAPGSNHAVVLFEIDQDGDLSTADSTWIRFQPFLAAQAAGGAPVAGQWNTYTIEGQDAKFLDAVNATTAGRKAYQSILELFAPVSAKAGTAGGAPTVLTDAAVFSNIYVAGGVQGFNVIEEYVDYLQMTFDTDPGANLSLHTVRYDFGATPPVPEPLTMASLLGGIVGLGSYIRKRTCA